MSVNISVSGSTLKECHEQILAIAQELNHGVQVGYEAVVREPLHIESPIVKETVVAVEPVVTQATRPQFPIAAAPSNDVDSRGIPYDERIHSSSREKISNGNWKKRRGVEQSMVDQVESELMGVAPAKKVEPFGSMTQEQYQQHVAPPKVTMPTTETHAKLPEEANVLAAAQIPATPAPTFALPSQPVLPPNTHNAESFRTNLITILNDLAAAGKINYDWINSQKPQFGGKEIVQWHENKAACDSLFEAFVSWGFINKL